MGLFDFLKGDRESKPNVSIGLSSNSNEQKSLPEYSDERKAECPYCFKALVKIPGSKTKCPHCAKFMFVRTSSENIRSVVTEEGAEKIEEDWSIFNGQHEEYLDNKRNISERKEDLKLKFGGRIPTENDVKWSFLNEETIRTASEGDWGLYRNTRFDMAEILRKEEKLKSALDFYLEVCYLDLNGPNNNSGLSGEFSRKAFDPIDGNAFLAPAVIDRIKSISKKLHISEVELQESFNKHNSRFAKSLNLPITTNDAWLMIQEEVF